MVMPRLANCGQLSAALLCFVVICPVLVEAAEPGERIAPPRLQRTFFPWGKGTRYETPGKDVPAVTRISESPDGTYVAWGDTGGNIFVSDAGGKHIGLVQDLASSRPAGKVQGDSGYDSRCIRLKDANTLYWIDWKGAAWKAVLEGGAIKTKLRLAGSPWSSSGGIIAGDCFIVSAPDTGLKFLFHPYRHVLYKYSLNDGKLLGTCEIYPPAPRRFHGVNAMALSHDGQYLAIASENNAGIVSLDPFCLDRTLDVSFGCALAFSPNDDLLAIASSGDKRLRVYDRRIHRFTLETSVPENGVVFSGVAFTSNRTLWFHYGFHLYCMDIAVGHTMAVLEMPPPESLYIGAMLYVGRRDGVVEQYSMPSPAASESPPDRIKH